VYDIGEVEGLPYLSMEYVDGEDLGCLLRRIGRIPADKAVEIARKICAGLAAAHDKGVLHRDLKPANIMLDGRGQVFLMDFGLAGLTDQIEGVEIRSGTPAYMSPEQLAGKEVTIRSDLYALGLVLYELFTGKRAVEGNTLAEIVHSQTEVMPISPTTLVQDLNPAVERVIWRCLEKDPRDRPPSALSVSAALPGGDPLAAALAAGETPSPEMVASAREVEGLKPMVGLICLVAIALGIVTAVLLAPKSTLLDRVRPDIEPETLVRDARAILDHAGYKERPVDTAHGFSISNSLIEYLKKTHKLPSTWTRPLPVTFWYRESSSYLNPVVFQPSASTLGTVRPGDPPPLSPGMIDVSLDPRGRLLALEAVPPRSDTGTTEVKAVDWNPLISSAGFETANLTPAKPTWVPTFMADSRAAWTGVFPEDPSMPVRIEGAAWQGKPVYFHVFGPWQKPDSSPPPPTTSAQIANLMACVFLFATIGGAVLLARHNARQNRGDHKGAFRLGLFVFCIQLGIWALNSHHTPTFYEFLTFVMAASWGLFTGTLLWLMYLALEPFIRRRWPSTLVSWSRVLVGRYHDPLVGSDVLLGIVSGVLWTVTSQVAGYINDRLGSMPSTQNILPGLDDTRHYLAGMAGYIPMAIVTALFMFLMIFLLRAILRKDWIAAMVFVAFLAISSALNADHPAIAATFVGLVNGFAVFVLMRYGILALTVGVLVSTILPRAPLTPDLSVWYSGNAMLAMGLVMALAAYAFHVARAGRPLLGKNLLD
jgi:serine/threonine-protein kinase